MNNREARQEWAANFIRAGRERGEIVRYGSPEWHALPYNDVQRTASVVVAAECWADYVDRLEERLHDEIMAARQIDRMRGEAEFAAVAAKVRAHANSPTWAEIRDRWAS